MKIVQTDDVRAFMGRATDLGAFCRSIGREPPDGEYQELALGFPLHMRFVIEKLAAEVKGELPSATLDSIPFYSLCRAVFLPLTSMSPEMAAKHFGIAIDPPPDTAAREALLLRFFTKNVGLTIRQKLACVLGDPFLGQRGTLRRDSLVRLLMSMTAISHREIIDRLSVAGDVSILFAQSRAELRKEPALGAAEVLETLRFLPDASRNKKFDVLRSLLERMGKLEAYFLAKLVLRKAGFGFEYQGPVLVKALATHFSANEEQIGHAMALTDAFHVARVLEEQGAQGLRAIQIQPLVPVKPALAHGTTEELKRYPVWVERKYDGIRIMIHKATDARGQVLCGAYTRARNDWLELIPGIDASIRALPAPRVIIDGELHGVVMDIEGARPATVYEVYAFLQGQRAVPVNLRYAAFDLIYLNGQDITGLPLSERRRILSTVLAPLQGYPIPIPVSLAEGHLAEKKEDVNRLFNHFRAQGYEGIITKDLDGTYKLAERDPTWLKRKPEVTLDLVLIGAVFAVTSKENVGTFGSYVIAARRADGSYEDVGDVAGLDKVRDAEIQAEIVQDGLMTGRRIERQSASGTRSGIELRPNIVVTVKFEGIARDLTTNKLSLRGPKLAVIRADKQAAEADTTGTIETLYLRQRVG